MSQFCQVQLLPQGRFQAFLRADSDERHRLLQRLFRTARFEDVEQWLRERRRTLRRDADRAHDAVAALVGRVAEAAGPSRCPRAGTPTTCARSPTRSVPWAARPARAAATAAREALPRPCAAGAPPTRRRLATALDARPDARGAPAAPRPGRRARRLPGRRARRPRRAGSPCSSSARRAAAVLPLWDGGRPGSSAPPSVRRPPRQRPRSRRPGRLLGRPDRTVAELSDGRRRRGRRRRAGRGPAAPRRRAGRPSTPPSLRSSASRSRPRPARRRRSSERAEVLPAAVTRAREARVGRRAAPPTGSPAAQQAVVTAARPARRRVAAVADLVVRHAEAETLHRPVDRHRPGAARAVAPRAGAAARGDGRRDRRRAGRRRLLPGLRVRRPPAPRASQPPVPPTSPPSAAARRAVDDAEAERHARVARRPRPAPPGSRWPASGPATAPSPVLEREHAAATAALARLERQAGDPRRRPSRAREALEAELAGLVDRRSAAGRRAARRSTTRRRRPAPSAASGSRGELARPARRHRPRHRRRARRPSRRRWRRACREALADAAAREAPGRAGGGGRRTAPSSRCRRSRVRRRGAPHARWHSPRCCWSASSARCATTRPRWPP